MAHSKVEAREYYKKIGDELKAKLNETLQATLTDPGKLKQLSEHFKLEGVYNYSFINTCMIFMQGGTVAQSFNQWKKLKRHVLPSTEEHQNKKIMVWRPFIPKKQEAKEEDADEQEDEKEQRIRFTLARVYDITDTDGEPVQYLNNGREINKIDTEKFRKGIEALGIKITVSPTGTARGFARKQEIVISESNNDTDTVKVLAHEAAHVLLGHTDHTNEKIKALSRHTVEVEAEAVSLLFQSYYGYETEMTEAYIQNWNSAGSQPRINKVLSVAEKLVRICNPKDPVKTEENQATA